jgi:N-acetylneuraminic acid mutarotase
VVNGSIYVVGGYNNSGTIVATNEAYPSQAVLTQIVVTPANSAIGVGTNQQFMATGEFSDGSSRVLTASSWTEEAPLPAAVVNSGAASINGVLYVEGGNNGGPVSTLYSYYPASNTWSNQAAMPGGRYQSEVGVISNELYVVGGWTASPALPNNNLWVYDPAANSWSTKASFPSLNGNGASGVINNMLYVTTPDNGYSGYYNYLDVYNPTNDSWTALASSPDAHVGPGFGVINNLFYVAGGVNDSGVVSGRLDVYNQVSNSWTTLAPMPTPRQSPASVVLNGQLWVIGGVDASGNALGTVEMYDPTTGAWTTEPSMPTPRQGASASVVNGSIYVVGGYNNSGTIVATNEGFNLGDGLVWSNSAPLTATIGDGGLATGLSAGSTTITATSGNISGSTPLTVVVRPTISIQPMSATVSSGGSVTLSVDANGGDLSYQWRFDGTNISGATGASLIITNVSTTNIGVYSVIVQNVAGNITSTSATLATVNIKMFAGVIIDGPIGSNYVIQATSNLSNGWTTVTNLALPSQPYIYIDYSSPTNPQQFYRALPTP